MNTTKYLLILMMGFPSFLVNAQDKKEKSKEESKPIVNKESQNAETLDTVNIYGDTIYLDREMIDQQGYDAVYDDNYSSDYVGKKRIEAYRGTTPSDLLSSFAGVYSGDSRNSGAIDPNIRGIQAEGRIKTRIDGTEQAITVYRGYNGSTNRNYIDPLLTSSIRIVKDSGLDTGVHTGIGGGVEIQTIGASDFIGEEGGFGGEVRFEASSNSNKVSSAQSYDGYKLQDTPNYDPTAHGWGVHSRNAYGISHDKKGKNDTLNIFNGNDYAGRIAIGYKADNWDVMAAVAKRKRGNYYSGKNNSGFYNQKLARNASDNYSQSVLTMAKYYKPGEDVFNTSSITDSYLFKVNWQPTDEHKLSASIRRSKSSYGEIMPKQAFEKNGLGSQWPLSNITADAFSLQYKFNPKDNDYIDLKTNVWMTKTDSDLYNSAGSLLFVNNTNVIPGNTIVSDRAKNYVNHTRKGLDLANRFKINNKVGITTFASLQDENLDSRPKNWGPGSNDWSVYPRKGKRREFDIGLNVNWQVNDKLSLDIGGKYMSYKKHDNTLEEALKNPNSRKSSAILNRSKRIIKYKYKYYTKSAQDIAEFQSSQWYLDQVANVDVNLGNTWDMYCGSNSTFPPFLCGAIIQGLSRADYILANRAIKIDGLTKYYSGVKKVVYWKRGADGKFDRKDNPCLNGTLKNTDGIQYTHAGMYCPVRGTQVNSDPVNNVDEKDHGFVPSLALNYQVNDDAKLYARYNESIRFPSLFEGLIGAGGYYGPGALRPEHSHKLELGYIHNLTNILPNAEVADIKVVYYQNIINNAIDRFSLKMKNYDKKVTKGLELQGRYDNGDFFTDFGINYTLKNKMCDEEFAVMRESILSINYLTKAPHVNECTDSGHLGTYMASHAVPKLSTKLHIGARFLDRKLTLGSRLTYYSEFDRRSYDDYMTSAGLNKNSGVVNPPYGWDKTILVDAYVRYKMNKNFMFEFTGNNLTDQYYIDPATRSTMPGPGRTFKLGITGKF